MTPRLLVCLFTFASAVAGGARTPARGPLRVCPRNRRYFTDGSGKAILLAGSHIGWELQDDAWGREHTLDYRGFLDFLVEHNHNFVRLWVVEHTRWDMSNPRAVASPMPWRRTGPGKALDGRPRFDLRRLDPAYFQRLRSRAAAAAERGIYVGVMLFQGFSVHTHRGKNPWFGHPFNQRNNVQGIDGDANGDGDGREIHTLANRRVTALQDAYVRKVVDTVNDLDNVLYEIANEAGGYSTAWQYHMIRFLKDYEATRPKRHPVGMTVQIRKGSNKVLFESPADWISPNRQGGYDRNPPAADGRKVVLSDTDHHGARPYPGRRQWVWQSFLRGHNPIFLDMYPEQETRQLDRIADPRLDPKWELIRRAMGHARAVAEQIGLAAMAPRNDLASSKYCLASPGVEYLVYLPRGGRVTVDLSGAKGTLAVQWLNPRTGKTTPGESANGGGRRTFAAPFRGDAVLHLVRPAAHKSGGDR